MCMWRLDGGYISNRVHLFKPSSQGLRADWNPAGRICQTGLNNSAWTLVRRNNDQQIIWELCLPLKHDLSLLHFGKLDFRAKRNSLGCQKPLHLLSYYRTGRRSRMWLRSEKFHCNFLFRSCKLILQEQRQTVRRDRTLDRQSRYPNYQSSTFKI